MNYYCSFDGFAEVNQNCVFSFNVYRKMFTPYEEKEAFMDESVFESNHMTFGVIEDLIFLPNRDTLIGFRILDDEEYKEPTGDDMVEYYLLSEIRIRRLHTINNCEEDNYDS